MPIKIFYNTRQITFFEINFFNKFWTSQQTLSGSLQNLKKITFVILPLDVEGKRY